MDRHCLQTGVRRKAKGLAGLIALCLVPLLAACAGGPVGNRAVPEPRKAVDLERYEGTWYEIARYENRFEKGCAGVTATYRALGDGTISVVNTCRKGGVAGPAESVKGKARVVEGSGNAKLKVSFFGPFYLGDYWVLDRAEDYSWSIVGEPSGRYLWILARESQLPEALEAELYDIVQALGYDTGLLKKVAH